MWYLYDACFHFLASSCTVVKSIAILLFILKIIQVMTIGKCKSMKCLVGKTAIVTGGSSGMGFETALVLASRGCRVIIADKNPSQTPKEEIIARTSNPNIEIKYVDLASLKSVRQFVNEIYETEDRLDILINNAGIGCIGNKYTGDGLHPTMQINHFGPFLLTYLLEDLLKRSAPSRIIFVSSIYSYASGLSKDNLNYLENHTMSQLLTLSIYGNSKLCNIISANGFAKRLKKFGVTSNSLHPGMVNTKIISTSASHTQLYFSTFLMKYLLFLPYGKTAEEGAQTTIHLALSDEVKDMTGKFFADCREIPMPSKAKNGKFCDLIWRESVKFVGLTEEEKNQDAA